MDDGHVVVVWNVRDDWLDDEDSLTVVTPAKERYIVSDIVGYRLTEYSTVQLTVAHSRSWAPHSL